MLHPIDDRALQQLDPGIEVAGFDQIRIGSDVVSFMNRSRLAGGAEHDDRHLLKSALLPNPLQDLKS